MGSACAATTYDDATAAASRTPARILRRNAEFIVVSDRCVTHVTTAFGEWVTCGALDERRRTSNVDSLIAARAISTLRARRPSRSFQTKRIVTIAIVCKTPRQAHDNRDQVCRTNTDIG